ncbi:Alcohol dehydrogenase superfamily, zinc-type [Artemisia annua]|uniref:Alcohol dehydrogenase superfamily, zinc-type n=1 Tax=Artemisia annua TaxID=35608 RepID=A0A2U1LG59_ARTAN|nr:Alcohol dehydrogenase superfamily, zinc-type [Artemisia annua]
MRELLKKCLPNSGIAEIISCANGRYVSDEQKEVLYSAGVNLKDVPSGSNSADHALMIETYKWAKEHRPPSYIVLISGDGDFYKGIGTLRDEGGGDQRWLLEAVAGSGGGWMCL